MGSHRDALYARLKEIEAEIEKRCAPLIEERDEINELLRVRPGRRRVPSRGGPKGREMRAAALAVFDDGKPHSLSEAMLAAGYAGTTAATRRVLAAQLQRVRQGIYQRKERTDA